MDNDVPFLGDIERTVAEYHTVTLETLRFAKSRGKPFGYREAAKLLRASMEFAVSEAGLFGNPDLARDIHWMLSIAIMQALADMSLDRAAEN